jgi:hypothetical protein
MADTGTGSGFELPDTSIGGSQITSLISSLVGDDRLGQNIARGLEPLLGNILSGQIKAGATSMANGQGAMFGAGTPNPGLNAYHTFNNNALSAVLTSSQNAIQEAQRRQSEDMHRFLGASRATAAAQSDDIFSVTNMMSKIAFASHQPYALQLGMEETARYMGAGSSFMMSPDMASSQESINNRATSLTAGITSDFFQNMEKYGGMGGKQVGQITAELARTGAINRNTGLEDATKAVQEMSKTVRSLRRFFDGDVADLMDNINGLTGTSFQSTFGSQSSGMINGLSATGFASGFTSSQMLSLAQGSGAVAQSLGMDPFSSLSNAQNIASYLGTARSTGDMRFINESRFRGSMTNQVTRANSSQTARALSGAGSLLLGALGSGESYTDAQMSRAQDFLSDVRASGRSLSPDEVAAQLSGIMGNSITGEDLINSSYTTGAEVLRASGYGTEAAMQTRAGVMSNIRRSALRDMTGNRFNDVMSAIGDGALTVENIQGALSDVYGESRGASMAGSLARGFGRDAKSLGLGNLAESDKFLATMANQKERDRIMQQAGISKEMQSITSEMGTLSGMRAIGTLMEKASGEGGLKFREAWNTLTGTTNIDMSSAHFRKLVGGQGGGVGDEAAVGINAAISAMASRQLGGKNASKEELEMASKILDSTGATSVEEQHALARKFARKHASAEIAQIQETKNAQKILENMYGENPFARKDSSGKSVVDAAALEMAQDRAGAITGLAGAGAAEGEKYAAFRKTRELYKDAIMTGKGSLEDIQDSFWEGREGGMSRADFEKSLKEQTAITQGGPARTNKLLEDLVNMVRQILENPQSLRTN